MPAENLDIHAVLRDVPVLASGWRAGRVDLRPLPGGCTNRTVLASLDGERYVVRVASARSDELRICRENEFRVWQAAAAAGIAPAIVHRDPHRGVLVYKFVDGHHWAPHEIERPGNLARLGRLLRATHSLPANASPFDPVALGLDFQRRVARERLPVEVADDWPARVRAICAGAAIDRAERRLCHNDPVRANFIDDRDASGGGGGARLWLIDWETAGVCDPYYDLATVAHNNRLSVEREAELIEAYEGRPRPEGVERLARMKVARDFYHVFWYAVQIEGAPAPEQALAGCTFHAGRLADELRSFDKDGSYLPAAAAVPREA